MNDVDKDGCCWMCFLVERATVREVGRGCVY